MAPPRIIDDALADAWVECIEDGGTIRSASEFCGVSHSSVLEIIRKGQHDAEAGVESFAASLADRYAHARGLRKQRWLKSLANAAVSAEKTSDQLSAAKWLLEHCEPDEFGDKSKIELTGKDGGPVQVSKGPDLSKLTDAELAQMEALLAKSAATDA